MKHWTDKHIKLDTKNGVWVGYNEAGLEHCRYKDFNKVKDSLIAYAKSLEGGEDA